MCERTSYNEGWSEAGPKLAQTAGSMTSNVSRVPLPSWPSRRFSRAALALPGSGLQLGLRDLGCCPRTSPGCLRSRYGESGFSCSGPGQGPLTIALRW